MKLKTVLAGVFMAMLVGGAGTAQKLEKPYTPKSIAGDWKGKLHESDSVPAVEIDLQPDGNSVAGKVIFYLIEDTGNGNVSRGKSKAQLLEPKFDGESLSFKVMREDGSAARFRMKFTADDEALLGSADEPSPTGREPIRLIRSR